MRAAPAAALMTLGGVTLIGLLIVLPQIRKAGTPMPKSAPPGRSLPALNDRGNPGHETLHVAANAPGGVCVCPSARVINGWCGEHGVGYVASLPVTSAMLFEALDAHGHQIDTDSFPCQACRRAMVRDGYCEACEWGFVDGRLYVSRLSWTLGRGHPRAPGDIECEACRRNAEAHGWCDECRVGQVGSVAFRDRELFTQSAREFDRLREAVRITGRCETCGVASFMRSRCPDCDISYREP